MSASTSSHVRINDTDANFRLWISAIAAALLAGGLVQTTDTGQINLGTVTRPLAANTAMGYEIWRSNDAAGGLNNFYMKIEYGSAGVATTPGIWVTIGWGSNGTGTLTGNLSTRFQFGIVGSSATPTGCNFAVGTGYVCIGMWVAAAAVNDDFVLSIERTRDTAGAVQDEVFIWGRNTMAGQAPNQVIPRTGTIGTASTLYGDGWRVCTSVFATYAGNKGISTLSPHKGGFLMESLNMFAGNSTDFATSQIQYTFTAYGAVHTYISHNHITAGIPVANQRLLLRYE